MRLNKIFDTKQDYQSLSNKSPDNFYFNLAQRAVKYISPINVRNGIEVSWSILNNTVLFKYSSKGIVLNVCGKYYSTKQTTLKALESLIYNIFQDDLKGILDIERPDNRTIVHDRIDFNRAPGTMFNSLYKSVTKDKQGLKNKAILGSRNTSPVFTSRQFELAKSVKSFKPSNFIKISNSYNTYYVNKSVSHLDFSDTTFIGDIENQPVEMTEQLFGKVLRDTDKYISIWARTSELDKLLFNIDAYKETVVQFKHKLWLIVPERNGFTVKEIE